MTGTRDDSRRLTANFYYEPREHTGVTEYTARRDDYRRGSDALLAELRALIEREATRARVTNWFAQACLVNGVDPAKHKRAA